MEDTITGLGFAIFLIYLGIIAVKKGWKLQGEQPFRVAVVFAIVLFLVASIIAYISIEFPVF